MQNGSEKKLCLSTDYYLLFANTGALYANATGIVPVIQEFVANGVSLGAAIVFMMAVVGLSLPEATLLKKVTTGKLIGIFYGIITLCIILLGYFFNFML